MVRRRPGSVRPARAVVRLACTGARPARTIARSALAVATAACTVVLASGTALAHSGLSGARPEQLAIPTWLFLLTGGAVVGASFLLTSFVTDRRFVRQFHARSRAVASRRRLWRQLGRLLGLFGLAVVLVAGLLGPREPIRNAAILLVWAGWWAGYTITVYAAGNSWPAVNPFRLLAAPLEARRIAYPERLGAWPAVVGLLALIWLEVVSPLADAPRFLTGVVVSYGLVTLAGAAAFGADAWFENVDPVACVFRQYGKVAPVQADDGGVRTVLPGARLVSTPASSRSEVGLVIALVWGTTYDGLVGTPLWRDAATLLVESGGVPPALLYPGVLGVGYLLFLAAYRAAIRTIRSLAPTYLTAATLERVFAPSLLAIAAGYHLAHYLGYFLSLSPALVTALSSPLSPGEASTLALPDWTGGLSIAFVLLGHLLAVWVAHGVAYDRFPSRLQAIRSQYPVTAVMVLYTMVSLWIVTQPSAAPPYL